MFKTLKKAGSLAFIVFAMPVVTVASMINAAGQEALKCGEITIKGIKEIVNK